MALEHVIASFESRCEWCGDNIEEGDAIVCVENVWVHADCAEDEGIVVV